MAGLLAHSAGLSSEQAEALARAGVTSVCDALLVASVDSTATRAPSALGVVHADALKRLVEHCAPALVPADVLWVRRKAKACMVRTCTELDALMGGGVMTGEVLELAGRSGSGKTWLCLATCAHVALELRAHALFVDTGANFCARAFLEECSRVARALDLPDEQVAPALRRVRVVRVSDADEVAALLEHVRAARAAKADAWYSRLALVVVDSPALALMPLLARGNAGHAWIVTISRALRALTHCNLAVVVTNHLVGAEVALREGLIEDSARLALGSSWRAVSDMRVYLDAARPSGATLAAAPTAPCTAWLERSHRSGPREGSVRRAVAARRAPASDCQ
ncbi:hypothetical protein KFE25_009233 [Diacronema lutheri]|uniref:AAA+ ATPase domain-containing protein n=1 Tax=Diacronema lutheri TaxID=2081491 RepID=A0A8J6CDB3_DIALT|nr:hypothetical protein KFE25_009233 [Diacronema lutheri]